MSEILFEMAERTCPDGWCRVTYQHDSSGNVIGCDDEGDQVTDDDDAVPTADEIIESWERYADYVLEHGEDPLSEYFVRYTYKRQASFTVELRDSVGGALACRWKRGRGPWSRALPPTVLANYMLCTSELWGGEPTRRPLKDTGTYYTIDELTEFANQDSSVKRVVRKLYGGKLPLLVIQLTIDETVKRSRRAVRAELLRIARKTR
jgi:hypothetical protein